MKKIIIPLILLVLVASGYVYYSSKQAPDVPVASAPNTEEIVDESLSEEYDTLVGTTEGLYEVVSGSVLGWKATKPTGFHTGDIIITTGTLDLNNGLITSGKFIFDMDSIVVHDDPNNAMLLKDIKEGIFSASTYPTSTFNITSVVLTATGYTVNGDLTITDQTHPISFPATIHMADENIVLQSAFAIDRRIWGLTALEGIANDYIEYTINLTFSPAR